MKLYAILIFGLFVFGCSRHDIPTYPMMPPTDGLDVIARRNAGMESIQARGTITLSDSKEQSVRLDGILLLQRSNLMRLRAWKVGQAVFDLTLNHDGAFQYLPREEAKGAVSPTREMLEHWQRALIGEMNTDLHFIGESSDSFTYANKNKPIEEWQFDRRTLTLTSIQVKDDHGDIKFELTLSDYRQYGAFVWPSRARARRDSGVIDIRFDDVEINGEVPAEAFKAPARAERLP